MQPRSHLDNRPAHANNQCPSGPILNFHLGKNTPERKDDSMAKLVAPVEE